MLINSNIELILRKWLGEDVVINKPASRVEALLIEIMESSGGGVAPEEVRHIVDVEIAKVVAEAPEDLDTLMEIADWIEHHEDDAAAMNSAIQANTQGLSNMQARYTELYNGIRTNASMIAEESRRVNATNTKVSNIEKLLADNAAKNILTTEWELGSITASGSLADDTFSMRTTTLVEVAEGVTYTFSIQNASPEIWAHYYSGETHIRREMVGASTDNVTFTIPQNENITAIKFRVKLTTESVMIPNTMLEHGSEATDYEVPYRTQRQIDAELTALRAEVDELRAMVLELQGS